MSAHVLVIGRQCKFGLVATTLESECKRQDQKPSDGTTCELSAEGEVDKSTNILFPGKQALRATYT